MASSLVHGPAEVDPVPHGWERSPQGAALAALTTQTFLATAGEELWPTVARDMVAAGPGRDQWVQARMLMDIEGEVEAPPRFTGFKFSQFDENDAIVILAADYPGFGLMAYPVQLVWQDDWKVVLPSQGQEPDLTPLSEDVAADFVSLRGQQ